MQLQLVSTRKPLAQVTPWEEPQQPAPPPAAKPMSFSDLQHGFRAYQSGETNDNTFRNGILVLIALIALVVLIIHFRQRRAEGGPPDSLSRLGMELGRLVKFPLGTRLMLWWVAREAQVPFASLLLSSALFDRCVGHWGRGKTLGSVRHWGAARLARLRGELFPEATSEVVGN